MQVAQPPTAAEPERLERRALGLPGIIARASRARATLRRTPRLSHRRLLIGANTHGSITSHAHRASGLMLSE